MTFLARDETLQLIGAAPDPQAATAWWMWAGCLVGALVVALLAARLYRRLPTRDIEQSDFASLCRALKVGRADAGILWKVAQRSGVPATAIVMSDTAFEHAATGATGLTPSECSRVEQLRRRRAAALAATSSPRM